MHSVARELQGVLIGLAQGELPWPLLLHGKPGRGKSCAALALADLTETAGFWTCEGLADLEFDHARGERNAEYERVGSKHLAILDELGTRANVGEVGYKVVKRFADVREAEAHRVAIYISNVAPHELAGIYDDRIASRLLCGTVFELKDEDRRSVRK